MMFCWSYLQTSTGSSTDRSTNQFGDNDDDRHDDEEEEQGER